MFEKFSDRVRKAASCARQTAVDWAHEEIRPEHLLHGILREGGGVAVKALKNTGVDLKALESDIINIYDYKEDKHPPLGQIPFSQKAKDVLAECENISFDRRDCIGTEHVLIGLLTVDSEAKTILLNRGLGCDRMLKEVIAVLEEDAQSDHAMKKQIRKSWSEFTKAVEEKVFDPRILAKGDWLNHPPQALLDAVEREYDEVRLAMAKETKANTRKELCDLAFACMMLWERLGKQ